ncbi:hypothetical protein ACPPVV_15415 [Rhodanobacter sp. Col0626]|uniref:hypothetical protein n=1 Tax=Rhodanobacter sp. Col0626 TaxID=3415679 RepID=UPI003CF0B9EB
MTRHRWTAWHSWLPTLAWLLLLALLPWWLGLPLLFSLVAVAVLLQHRLDAEHVGLIRRGLRWGLPGVLFALQRALGGNAFAWGAALLGALAGYTLLAGLEAWLDRDLRRAASAPATASAEWPELAMAPIGPAAEIIELQPLVWHQLDGGSIDPLAGRVHYRGGSCFFDDGHEVPDAGPQATFSPDGRWFAARTEQGRGIVLWDRERDRRHRLRGWKLSGWYREQPWLARHDDDIPQTLAAVLGRDDED